MAKQRKIQLEKGDTLGGTVPLLMQNSVRASADGRLGATGSGFGSKLRMVIIFAVLAFAGTLYFRPDLLVDLTPDWVSETWTILEGVLKSF